MPWIEAQDVDKWLRDTAASYERGFMPVHRKIMAHIGRQTKARFKMHMDPDGRPWPQRKLPQWQQELGRPGPIRLIERPKKGTQAWRAAKWAYIKTSAQWARASVNGQKMIKARYGREKAAMYRTRGPDKRKKLFRALTVGASRKAVPGVVNKGGSHHMIYGLVGRYNAAMRLHMTGGIWNKRSGAVTVPRRVVLGLNRADIAFSEKAYLDYMEKMDRKAYLKRARVA